jgi:hypothetical protein
MVFPKEKRLLAFWRRQVSVMAVIVTRVLAVRSAGMVIVLVICCVGVFSAIMLMRIVLRRDIKVRFVVVLFFRTKS